MDCGELIYSDETHRDCSQRPTLLDHFAMAAPEAPRRVIWGFEMEEDEAKADAEWRYIHAAAMLKAREKGDGGNERI